MILTERLRKYQLYHQVKLIDINLTGEEIWPSNQQQIIAQAKCTYSPLGKAFGKQTKTIKDQGEKQIKTIEEESNKQIKNTKNKWH